MRRAILFLAALAAGVGGCHSNSCPNGGTVSVYWQPPQGGFTSATGQLLGCDQAGVNDLDVSVNGQIVASHVPCHGPSADGVQLFGFGNETVNVQVDAYDVGNRLLYQDVTTVNTAFCADTLLDVNLAAVQASFRVSYALPGGNTCPPNSFVWYSLVDVSGNAQFSVVDAQNSPTAVPCGTELTFDNALFGVYRLDFIQVVQPTGDPRQPWSAVFQYCSPLNFNHNTANDVLTVPTLIPAMSSCG